MKNKEQQKLTCDEFEFRLLGGGEAEITGYSGGEAAVAVPDLIGDGQGGFCSVKVIGRSAFACHEEITRLRLPRSLRKIGAKAFEGCSRLEWMRIPDSVKVIGAQAFEGCGSLRLTCSEDSCAKKAAELAGIEWAPPGKKDAVPQDEETMNMEGDYMKEIERGGYMPVEDDMPVEAYMPEDTEEAQTEAQTEAQNEAQNEEESEGTQKAQAYWPDDEALFEDWEMPHRMCAPEGRRRRMRRAMRRGKRVLLACAAAALLAMAITALVRLSSAYRLVKVCDQAEVEYTIYMMEECGGALTRMASRLQMYTGLACGEDQVIPQRERTQMVGEMRYETDHVEETGARARMALARLARSGSILRATGQSVDLHDAFALLDAMENGALCLSGYAKLAADMMADGELWKRHGRDVLACLDGMAEAMDELAVCGQAALFRRFLSEEQLLAGSWSGDVCAMLMNLSEGEVYERGMRSLSAMAGLKSRMDTYQALVEAARTEAMENVG